MSTQRVISASPILPLALEEERQRLSREFSRLPEVFGFLERPEFSARVASLGIVREVGTVNDALARFVFDQETGEVVPLESLRAETIQWGRFSGVRIWSESASRLELRARAMLDLVHPDFSYAEDGSLEQLVIFPEFVARILAHEGIEAVLVKKWGQNSIFGGFDPSQGYYQTNIWELENNDSLLFSKLASRGQLALLGTHDLIAHAAGADRKSWEELRVTAARVHQTIQDYFSETSKPSIAALILPYTAGVVLDDLAQPPSFGSAGHLAVLEVLLGEMKKRSIAPGLPTYLRKFPASFQNVIELSRAPAVEKEPERIRAGVARLLQEIRDHVIVQAS